MRLNAPRGSVSPMSESAINKIFPDEIWWNGTRSKSLFCRQGPRPAVDRWVVDNLVELRSIQMKVQRVKNTFSGGVCLCSRSYQFFVGSVTLRADCDIFVSRPNEEFGCQLL